MKPSYLFSKAAMREAMDRLACIQQRAMSEEADRRAGKQRTPCQQQQGRQLFQDGPYVDPPTAPLTTLTSTSIEDMWAGITWTPIFANDAKAGKIYCVRAGGTISLTGGTAIITPQWGPAGTTLGASLTVGTVTVAIAAWYLAFDLVVKTVGAAGANSTVHGTGYMMFNGGVVSGSANPNLIVFGGTSASVDTTINGNITIRKTLSTTNSVIPQYVYIFSRN